MKRFTVASYVLAFISMELCSLFTYGYLKIKFFPLIYKTSAHKQCRKRPVKCSIKGIRIMNITGFENELHA